MDRLVKADTKEVEMIFLKGQKCSSSFKLTNLMHTMSVAVSFSSHTYYFFSLATTIAFLTLILIDDN